MACTATATKSVREEVLNSMEMTDCVQISVSPDRPNIYYEVRHRTDVASDMSDLLQLLNKKLVATPRVIVYCQSLDTCTSLFAHFLYVLGEEIY